MKRICLITATAMVMWSTLGVGVGFVFAGEERKSIFDLENFSATFTLATDYVFRGISQTDSKPAAQGSFDYAHPIGIYLGVWGSNVNSDISKGGVELDYYLGYMTELFTDFNLDLSVLYYSYPGGGSDPEPNYFEGHLGLDYKLANLPLTPKLGAGYWYSPDFFGEDGKAHYVNGVLELFLPYEFILAGEFGYQYVKGDETTGHGQGENGGNGYDYNNWRIGISRELLKFILDLSYHDTNEANFLGKDIADERLVFTLSRSF